MPLRCDSVQRGLQNTAQFTLLTVISCLVGMGTEKKNGRENIKKLPSKYLCTLDQDTHRTRSEAVATTVAEVEVAETKLVALSDAAEATPVAAAAAAPQDQEIATSSSQQHAASSPQAQQQTEQQVQQQA